MIDDAVQAKLTSSSTNDLRVSIRLPKREGSGEKLSYGRISRSVKTSKSSKKEGSEALYLSKWYLLSKIIIFFWSKFISFCL